MIDLKKCFFRKTKATANVNLWLNSEANVIAYTLAVTQKNQVIFNHIAYNPDAIQESYCNEVISWFINQPFSVKINKSAVADYLELIEILEAASIEKECSSFSVHYEETNVAPYAIKGNAARSIINDEIEVQKKLYKLE